MTWMIWGYHDKTEPPKCSCQNSSLVPLSHHLSIISSLILKNHVGWLITIPINNNVGYPCCWIIHTSIMTIVILLSQYSPMIIPLTIPSSPRPGTWAVANGPKGRYSSESPRSAAGDVFFLFCFGLLQTLGLYGIIWDYMELLDVVRL